MFKFLLFIFILIYVIYKISTFYVKTFIGKSVNNFKKSKNVKKNGVLDEEGNKFISRVFWFENDKKNRDVSILEKN